MFDELTDSEGNDVRNVQPRQELPDGEFRRTVNRIVPRNKDRLPNVTLEFQNETSAGEPDESEVEQFLPGRQWWCAMGLAKLDEKST